MPQPDAQDEKISKVTGFRTTASLLDSSDETTAVDLSEENLNKIPEKEKLYSRGALATFSVGMVDPFLTTIAIDMNISSSLMGWLRAITNLLGTFIQPFFGFLSDKVKRRSILIALSNLLYSTTWIVLLFINDVIFLIIMAGFLSLVGSLGVPAWTALLGEVVPTKIRGRVLSKVNWFSQFSNIASTILGGLLLNYVVGEIAIGSWSLPLDMFLTIGIGLIAGFASAFIIFTFKEKQAKERAQQMNTLLKQNNKPKEILSSQEQNISIEQEKESVEKSADSVTITSRLSTMFRDKEFMKFTIIFGIQSFFMSFCWPLFPIRQRSDIGADYFEIAVFSVTMTIATILTVRYAGHVSDLIGRKPQIFLNRLILVTMPLGYMFASEVWHIILIHAVICIPLGLNSTVMQAYLIDITPEEDRSLYVGFYNMFYGVILFLGSLAGGYLVDFLMGEFSLFSYTLAYEQYTAVTIAFVVGFIGRLITTFPFLALKEVKEFPYKFRDLPKLALKSRKTIVLIISVVAFFALLIGFMFLMGYLP